MREPMGAMTPSLPRPGRTLKWVLAVLAVFAVLGAIIVNWMPGGELGMDIFSFLAFKPGNHATVLLRPWAIVTSGLLTSPVGVSHVIYALIGLYFLTTDLESRWGGARLLRFLVLSVVMGNLAVLAGTFVPLPQSVFHPAGFVFGPFAAIFATTMAWAKENQHREIRFMFFVPMSGRTLFWVTIAGAGLAILFMEHSPEGPLAIVGGVGAGILFGGTPSPARSLWLRLRLGALRRKGGGITVEQLLNEDAPARPRSSSSVRRPPLRVVPGGLDDDLKNRKPPKDKRYLN